MSQKKLTRRHPDWLKVKIPGGKKYVEMKKLLRNSHLHTICEEAKCPNLAECFGCGTSVFLILGDICSRDCGYCNVTHGTPRQLNPDEPMLVAQSVVDLELKYAVITSVTRDDLDDGGAAVFVETIKDIRKLAPKCGVEVLIPDFLGSIDALRTVVDEKPDVINHNIEVVKDLFSSIRPQGNYELSLEVLENCKKLDDTIHLKSGLMVGLGESWEQIVKTLKDLRSVGVEFVTIGQYLQPSKNHVPVCKYYTPEEFEKLKKIALNLGFSHVESGPLVRSSYHAQDALR